MRVRCSNKAAVDSGLGDQIRGDEGRGVELPAICLRTLRGTTLGLVVRVCQADLTVGTAKLLIEAARCTGTLLSLVDLGGILQISGLFDSRGRQRIRLCCDGREQGECDKAKEGRVCLEGPHCMAELDISRTAKGLRLRLGGFECSQCERNNECVLM